MGLLYSFVGASKAGDRKPPWIAGRYYDHASSHGAESGTVAVAANTIMAVPIMRPGGGLIDRIGLSITAAGAANSKVRLGIGTIGGDGKPDTLLLDSGELATDAIADVEATIAHLLAAGPVFLLACYSGTPTVRATVLNDNGMGYAALGEAQVRNALSAPFTYGPLPADLSALTWTSGTTPTSIRLRAA